MFLNHFETDVPRWTKWSIDAKKLGDSLPLFDNLRLETDYQNAISSNLETIIVRIQSHEYTFHVNAMRLEDKQTKQQFFVSRDMGYSFSYLFDRKFEFFLCIEQFVFVTPKYKSEVLKQNQIIFPIEYQPVVILDGEVIRNLRDGRKNYSIFDVICCTGDDRYNNETTNFCAQTMSVRQDAMKLFVCETHHFFNKKLLSPNSIPRSLQIIAKHFYKKSEFDELRKCITKSPTDPNKFVYKNYNLNDGLIFTPDNPKLYTFSPGNNKFLLKWKWPSRLTSDFLAVPVPGAEPNYFFFYFLCRSDSIFYRTIKVSLNTDHKILDELGKLEHGSGSIVECSLEVPLPNNFVFDPNADIQNQSYISQEPALWKIEQIRGDKNHANALKVIANTLENIVEDITENDLRFYLKVSNGDTSGNSIQKQEDELLQRLHEEDIHRCQCYAHFRVQRHHKKKQLLFLSSSIQVYFNNKQQKTHWVYYYNYTDCLFSSDQVRSDLTHIIEQNQEKLPDIFVKCIFIPQMGKWKILDTQGDESRCSATNLLRVLEYNVCLNKRLKSQITPANEVGNTNGEQSSNKRKQAPPTQVPEKKARLS
jgi:hypothetical protein